MICESLRALSLRDAPIVSGALTGAMVGVSSPHATCRSGHLRGVTIVTHFVHCRFATESYLTNSDNRYQTIQSFVKKV